ncbi:MAG: hypothetical protein HOH33_06870 [Verrucomicrobia bacterium]|jgi:hypothetical protein|nr:hypothetical protein [Verrucomicrobiota bacterium]
MCNQTVSLAAAELEKRGIATVVLQFMKDIALKVGPPRALWVPFPHGFALGNPGDTSGQRKVLNAALSILSKESISPPHLEIYGAI